MLTVLLIVSLLIYIELLSARYPKYADMFVIGFWAFLVIWLFNLIV